MSFDKLSIGSTNHERNEIHEKEWRLRRSFLKKYFVNFVCFVVGNFL